MMKTNIVVVVVLVLGLARPAVAQMCGPEKSLAFSRINYVELMPSACYDSSVYWHFLGSRAAYAAQLVERHLDSTCDTDQGAACLKYTGECSPDVVNPTLFSCPRDPSAQRGEISCWCHARLPVKEPIELPAGSANAVRAPGLFVDTDLNRIIDRRYPLSSYPDVVQMTELPGGIVRMGFEDDILTGTADYNDYIAAVEIRDCSPVRFPVDATDRPECANSCGASCPSGWVGLDSNKFRVVGTLGVDDSVTEQFGYEPIGRKLSLTLSLYANFLIGELNGRPLTVAMCPTVNLKWQTTASLYAGAFGEWSISDGTCSAANPATETASCVAGQDPGFLPIALSGEQNRTSDPCRGAGDRGTGVDLVLVNESACSAETHVREYEFRIADLDSIIGEPRLMYGPLGASSIAAAVESVDVRVFANLPNGGSDFRCPGGVGTQWGSNQPGNGDVLFFRLKPGITGGLDIRGMKQ